MMDTLRGYAKGWASQLLLVILVLSFAVWGVSDFFTGFQQNTVARVGSTDISVIEFQRSYDQAVRQLSTQFGMPVTQEQARQMGIPGQILGRLVNQATLDETAASLGMGISDEMLGMRIASDPQYFGTSGTFDRGYLSQLIASQGMTEDDFIIQSRSEYIRGQLGQALAGGISAPEAYLRAVQEFRGTERDVAFVVVSAPPEADIPAPDDTALAAYFDAHKSEWNAPELRAFTYITLSPATVARAEDITDEEARARYDASPARFSTTERRQVQQIVFPTRVEAEAAAAAIASGKTFDDIVAERALQGSDIDLGLVARDELVDSTIAAAAFGLALNTPSGIVEGAFGPVILRVVTIEPAVVTGFDEVKDQLKLEIASERAATEIAELHDAIEDARAGGDSIADVASRYGLPVTDISDVDAQGNDADGTPISDLPPTLVAGVFDTDIDFPNAPIETERGTWVWYDVTAVTAPRERPLAEVRERVITAWKEAERQRLLDETATAARDKVQGTRNIDQVAMELGLTVQRVPRLARTAAEGALSSEAIAAAFSGLVTDVVIAPGIDPLTTTVLVVENEYAPTFDPNQPELTAVKEQVNSDVVADLIGLYVGELQKKTDVRINEAVLQQVLGLGTVN